MRGVFCALACLVAVPAMAQDPEAGAEVFQAHCAVCHGVTAEGDGPMAEILTTMPRDLTRLADWNGGVFPVFRVVRQIDGRDPMLAHGGEMPVFGGLYDFPDGAIA